MQAVSINSRQRIVIGYVYTHHLPYGIRHNICNLLDADQSWRTLGGQFMHLDATQLKLIGQAPLRNESPTEVLLNKLDSANMRISELVYYLAQMGHCRALELLKPYVIDNQQFEQQQQQERQPSETALVRNQFCAASSSNNNNNNSSPQNALGSLNTPTPSFNSIQPMAIMNVSELNLINPADYQNQNPDDWSFIEASSAQAHTQQLPNQRQNAAQRQVLVKPSNCHNVASSNQTVEQPASPDPGEEIVRLACANNKKRTSISDQEVVNQLRLIMQITYNELKQASDDFADSNILGNGGFASVYRGHWKGTDVAIKRLRCNLMDQALNELTILNSYRIDNILPIYGISIDGPEACLVYQFMANGSLEDRLSCKNGTQPLTWSQRVNIAEGVAKGLFYLHTLRDKPLVHGDAKSANVLLDSQFVPKLGDFGLARQVFRGKNPQADQATHCTVSSIHGTSVYLPPEYLRHKILSPAVDAYSYGIVLLEMATGKRAYDGKRLLIDFVEDEMRLASNPRQVNYNLKDFRLPDETHGELRICFELLLRLGLNCAHRIKKKRADMGQVLNHLARFRQNANASPNIDAMSGSLVSGLPTPASNATTRTVTPDLATGNAPEIAFRPFRFQAHQANQNAAFKRDESNLLMSVEEEEGQGFVQHGQLILNPNGQNALYSQQQGNQLPLQQHLLQAASSACNNNQADASQVEAMIPLLTELGFTAQQE